jgi:hypothetical protein
MTAIPSFPRWPLALLAVLLILGPLTSVVGAAEPGVAAAPLLADYFLEVVSDRSRLIQVSLLIVVLGIAIMWWHK